MRRFFHGKHCNNFGARLFKPSSLWFWLALVFSPLASLADSLMDAQDIFEQWSQYVDSEVAAHLSTAKQLYEYCGSEASFGDSETGGVGLKVGSVHPMVFQSRDVILPRWCLVVTSDYSDSIITDYVVTSYDTLPDYLGWCSNVPTWASNRPTFYSQVVAYSLSDSGVSNYVSRHFRPSWTNFLFRFAANFAQGVESVISVPYGPYWYQDNSVGWCTSSTYREITGQSLEFEQEVWMMIDLGHSPPLSDFSLTVLNYSSSDSSGFVPLFFPDGASYRDSLGLVFGNSIADPLIEKNVLHEVFPHLLPGESYTNLFKPGSFPW